MNNTISTLVELYEFLDSLFDQDCDADTLFASGYLRGFISLVASDFGDENMNITTEFIEAISQGVTQAKSELSPQDSVIVNNFWLQLQHKFTA